MPSFCAKCGFPQSANSAFCSQCGSRVAGAQGGPSPSPQPAAAAGSGLKTLLIVVASVGVAAAAVVGGLHYFGSPAKKDGAPAANPSAANPSATTNPAVATRAPAGPPGSKPRPAKICDLLSSQEVSRLLGEPIERTVDGEGNCSYYGPPGLAAKLAQEHVKSAIERAGAPDSPGGGSDLPTAIDELINNLGPGVVPTENGGEMPLLLLVVGDDGPAQMFAMRQAKGLFNKIFQAAGAKGLSAGGEVSGLGDQAIRMPKLGLNVLRGETIIRVIAGPIPDVDARSIDVARTVLSRL